MAGELSTRTQYTGETIYALVFDRTAQVLTVSGPTFGAYATANLGNYDIPLTEQGTASKRYEGDLPAMASGYYDVEFHLQAGGSPSEANDLLVGTEYGYWDSVNSTWTPINNNLATTANQTTIISALKSTTILQGTLGATGNTTTTLHLDGLTYGNDEINTYRLLIHDNSADEYHVAEITDWVLSSELATVATLPFTPEASVDTYWLMPPGGSSSGGGTTNVAVEVTPFVVELSTSSPPQGDVTIQARLKIDGVLTNADTSVKLSDSAAAFGVKRNDTDAAVVADDTSMTNAATGVYEYEFTQPASNLEYTIAVEVVHDGATYRSESTFSGTSLTAATVPQVLSMPRVKLYQDLVDHLVDFTGGAAQDKQLRQIKRAINTAVDQVANERSWQYFWRVGRINTVAAYQTGTIVYDHTGGSSERLVTLSDGTFPTWAKFGKINIGSVIYDVDQYLTSTTLTLTEERNPGADVASTSYTIFRDSYPLPVNFKSLSMPENEDGGGPVWWTNSQTLLHLERNNFSLGTPYRFTVEADPDQIGGFVAVFEQYPSSAETIDFVYQASPWVLRRTGHEATSRAGTVTVSANGSTITGSSTSFSGDMQGAFIRLQSGSDYPTGLEGENPFVEQHRIREIIGATSLALETATTSAYSGKKYTISDPIDLDQTIFNAVLKRAEMEMASMMGHSNLKLRSGLYAEALDKALEWDSKLEREIESGTIPFWLYPNYNIAPAA